MLKWAGNLCLIVALLAATDAQWLVLQSVAWAGMIASYSERAPFGTALAQTFDGKHPCPLCKAIAAGKKSEKQNELLPPLNKLEFPPAPDNFVLVAPSHFQLLPLTNMSAESLASQPPTPPPRSLFV